MPSLRLSHHSQRESLALCVGERPGTPECAIEWLFSPDVDRQHPRNSLLNKPL